MATLLQALLKNESGGRNIPNVDQGTSSGQAQGYFQITTGTWDDFGGRKYAENPLGATYEQQAEIASKIPLKRWDKSTLAAMQATGRPIDPNRTLGENLAMHGESFAGGARDGGVTTPAVTDGPKGQEVYTPPNQYALSAQHPPNPTVGTGGYVAPGADDTPVPGAEAQPNMWQNIAKNIGKMGGGTIAMQGLGGSKISPQPAAARLDQGDTPTIDPQQQEMQRQQLAMVMQRLNSGRLF